MQASVLHKNPSSFGFVSCQPLTELISADCRLSPVWLSVADINPGRSLHLVKPSF